MFSSPSFIYPNHTTLSHQWGGTAKRCCSVVHGSSLINFISDLVHETEILNCYFLYELVGISWYGMSFINTINRKYFLGKKGRSSSQDSREFIFAKSNYQIGWEFSRTKKLLYQEKWIRQFWESHVNSPGILQYSYTERDFNS